VTRLGGLCVGSALSPISPNKKRNEAATAAARDAARDAAQEAARTIEAAYGPGQLDPRPAAGPVKGYWMSVRRGGAAGWQGV
jgi:hypothetical protein